MITIALGVLVLMQWPVSGLWVIGIFIGIDLIFCGIGWIAVAFGLRSLGTAQARSVSADPR